MASLLKHAVFQSVRRFPALQVNGIRCISITSFNLQKYFSEKHEYVDVKDEGGKKVGTVGITDYAQSSFLADIDNCNNLSTAMGIVMIRTNLEKLCMYSCQKLDPSLKWKYMIALPDGQCVWWRKKQEGMINSQEATGKLSHIPTLAEPDTETHMGRGEAGVLESVKAASEVFSPVSGIVTAVNPNHADKPNLVNESPYDKGWLFKIKLSEPEELKKLMNEETYLAYIKTIE